MTTLLSASAPYTLDVTGADRAAEATLLRDRGPVVPVVLPGGVRAWAVTDYAVLKTVFGDHLRFSKDAFQHWPAFIDGEIPPDWPLSIWVQVRNMLTAYGPDHARLRKLISPAFTPRRVAAMRPRIEQIVTYVFDDLATHSDSVVDLRELFAAQVPLRVITALMGVPDDLQDRLRVCVGEIFAMVQQRDPQETFAEMIGLLTELVRRRAEFPGDDMTSLLITHRDEGHAPLSDEELVHTLVLVISAGYETTINLLEQAITAALHRPALAELLRTDPGADGQRWRAVIEETLRTRPPIAVLPLRFAVVDLELAGLRIAAGDPVIAAIAAANRPGPEADEFDPSTPREHLSFGHGAHFCLGAALARLEAGLALPALFDRFPDLALETGPGYEPVPLPSFISWGSTALWARLTTSPTTPVTSKD